MFSSPNNSLLAPRRLVITGVIALVLAILFYLDAVLFTAEKRDLETRQSDVQLRGPLRPILTTKSEQNVGDIGPDDDEIEIDDEPKTIAEIPEPSRSQRPVSLTATDTPKESHSLVPEPSKSASRTAPATTTASATPPVSASGSPLAVAMESTSGSASPSALVLPASFTPSVSAASTRASASAVPSAASAALVPAGAWPAFPNPRSLMDPSQRNPHSGTALWIRTFSLSEATLDTVLLTGLRAFWPPRRFGRTVLVLDPTDSDRQMGQRLLTKYGGQEIAQEGGQWVVKASFTPAGARALGASGDDGVGAAPRDLAAGSSGGVLTDPMLVVTYGSNEHCSVAPFCFLGYHRQQYDTLHADENVPESFPGHHPDEEPSAVIGITDSDALLLTLPHEHTYFDAQGRPRVIPRVGLPIGPLWAQSAAATLRVLGVPEPGRGMSYFPVYFKRAHFAALRAHMVKHAGGKALNDIFQLDLVAVGFYR